MSLPVTRPGYTIETLPSEAARHNIKLAAVAVPAVDAQQVADLLARSGIEGILNFAPVTLKLPEHVKLVEVDLAIQLEQLSFLVVRDIHGDGGEEKASDVVSSDSRADQGSTKNERL